MKIVSMFLVLLTLAACSSVNSNGRLPASNAKESDLSFPQVCRVVNLDVARGVYDSAHRYCPTAYPYTIVALVLSVETGMKKFMISDCFTTMDGANEELINLKKEGLCK